MRAARCRDASAPRRVGGVLVVGVLAVGAALPAEVPGRIEWRDLPRRPDAATTGSQFARATAGRSGPERQRAAVAEILAGNVPSFLRTFVPVAAQGAAGDATFFVLPDYLAIGSDEDFLRIPLTMPSVVAICSHFGLYLPTPMMVDRINATATVHLEPISLPPGPTMRSSEFYLRHQRLIEEQVPDGRRGALTSGHKKDVVVTRRLRDARERIAIYGWHRLNASPIQRLSLVHGARYADYSHGVRLVFPEVWIDEEPRDLRDVLRSPQMSTLFTREGPMAPRLLLGLPAAARE